MYGMKCPKGHSFDVFAPMKDAPRDARCACGLRAKRVYTVPQMKVDGEHSGYYDDALGFPKDPTNPMKSICPSKRAAKDAFKRAREESGGGVSYE